MNNNPIKMLFDLGNTGSDVVKNYIQNGEILSGDEKIDFRINVCYNCKCLDKETSRCSLCGCFMKVKVKLDAAKCPIGKW